MGLNPLTQVAIGVATVPTALAAGSIGMTAGISPSTKKVDETHEKISELENNLGDRLGEMITQAVQESVNKLKEDLLGLKKQISGTENKFNSQLRDDSQDLLSRLSAIKEGLLSSISEDESDLKEKLQQIESQLRNSENSLENKLDSVTLSLEDSIGLSLEQLSNLLENKVKSSQSSYHRLLERIKRKLSNLEKDLTPSITTYSCTVKLNKVREKVSTTLQDPKEAKTWTLEEFLTIVKGQENVRPTSYTGHIPTASELERNIKAKCFGDEKNSEVLVNKKFTFYELVK